MNLDPQKPLRIAVIVASTRPGRKGPAVGGWVLERARQRAAGSGAGAVFEIVDIADFGLPMLDEPVPAIIKGEYEQPHTKVWSAAIAGYDGFIFVTPEYNHSVPGSLKNAIDFLFWEWANKAAGFISYGVHGGGVRAIEHLRLIMAEVGVAGVRSYAAFSLFDDFEGSEIAPGSRVEAQVDRLVDELITWGTAMRIVRSPALASSRSNP